ncbi:MAG: TRAP transporter substrate-binding protein DctP [Thermodesulfobacteriota bacterium]|nr:TRAP transporter substrate-binding protein DctP [Thermodesulfobacteriota bacterium]
MNNLKRKEVLDMAIRKICNLTLLLFVLLLCWTALSIAERKKPKVILKMASNAPKDIGVEVYIRKQVSPGVKRVSNGEVVIDWFHGGIMGDNRDWISKMQIDQLQGAALDGSGIHLACPEAYIFQLPFIFYDFNEVAYVKEKLRSRMDNSFQRNGYKMLMLFDQSFDKIYSTKREPRTLENLAKIKFAAYAGLVENEIIKALGANPIPMNVPEIVSSTRAGICNGLFSPALWYAGSQLYTIAKHVTVSNIRYTPACMTVTMNAWNRISENHQKAIEDVMRNLEPGLDQNLKDSNANCHRAMVKYGMNEIKWTPDEVEVFKKKTRPVWDKLVGKVYTRDLLNEILEYLEEYRSKKAT